MNEYELFVEQAVLVIVNSFLVLKAEGESNGVDKAVDRIYCHFKQVV